MKDEIVKKLDNINKAKSISEIFDLLGLASTEDEKQLENTIRDLVSMGILHETKKHKYMLMKNCCSLRVGKIDINKSGNGFVDLNDYSIFIKKKDLNNAIDDDLVEVDCFERKGSIEGKVIRILKRNLKNIVGEIVKENNKLIFKPDNNKLNIYLKITNESLKKCVEGYKVVVNIVKDLGRNHYLGEVTSIIGHKSDPGVDIISIALKHGIACEFSDSVKQELEEIPTSVDNDELIGRKNLTDDLIFTIDGDDTKDIDDAISLEKHGDIYHLGVHIADVSHYVKYGSQLYEEAYSRGTSSYLADTVIPMIPHLLSNGICSLNPNEVRLTISCVMDINSKGKVVDYDIFPSYIMSKKKMTYKNVNEILMNRSIPKGYEEYKDVLLQMNELAHILRKSKERRGYIDFGTTEAKIVQDSNGKAIDVVKRVREDGENLIEDFMIVANETVATHISNMDLPFIYRVHDVPSSDRIMDFNNLLKQLGYNFNIDINKITPFTIQNMLKELSNKKEFNVLSNLLLRSMKKAIYSTNNIGHFGLASKNYTHFTSPIRRFPDLTVHNLLRTYLFNGNIDSETIKFNEEYLIGVAENSSEREVASQNAENDVLDMKMAEYMEDKVGNIYTGIITSVTSFGFFVQLENLVEGLVHVNSLNGYYNYVPELLSLVGSNGKRFRVGDEITVIVVGASKDNATIDFEVYHEK